MSKGKPKGGNPDELENLLALFDKLDTNQDGVICISDLKEAVKSRKIPEELHSAIAKVIMQFLSYCCERKVSVLGFISLFTHLQIF